MLASHDGKFLIHDWGAKIGAAAPNSREKREMVHLEGGPSSMAHLRARRGDGRTGRSLEGPSIARISRERREMVPLE